MYVSLTSVFGLLFTILLEIPTYVYYYRPTYVLVQQDWREYLEGYGNFIYAFNMVMILFVLFQKFQDPTKEKLNSVFQISISLCFICYFFISIGGYLSLGEEVRKHDLFILREEIPKHSDLLMKSVSARKLKSVPRGALRGPNHPHNPPQILGAQRPFSSQNQKPASPPLPLLRILSHNDCPLLPPLQKDLLAPGQFLRNLSHHHFPCPFVDEPVQDSQSQT